MKETSYSDSVGASGSRRESFYLLLRWLWSERLNACRVCRGPVFPPGGSSGPRPHGAAAGRRAAGL